MRHLKWILPAIALATAMVGGCGQAAGTSTGDDGSGGGTSSPTGSSGGTKSYLYLTCSGGGGTLETFSVDTTSGALTPIGAPFPIGGAGDVVADSAGKNLYVATGVGGKIMQFQIDPSTGATSQSSPGLAFGAPLTLKMDPNGKNLYVGTNATPAQIQSFPIDPTSGALSNPPGSAITAGSAVSDIAVDPSGSNLYAASGNGTILQMSIDPTLGTLTSKGTVAASGANYVAVHPNGKFLYSAQLSGGELQTFQIGTNGALSLIASHLVGSVIYGLNLSPDGSFLFVDDSGQMQEYPFAINGTTGALTQGTAVVLTGSSNNIYHPTISPDGAYLYMPYPVTNAIGVFAVNTSTGALTYNTSVSACTTPTRIAVIKVTAP